MKPWLTKARRFSKELPLQTDDNARFMPWIMAVMVFLLSLSIAFAGAMQSAVGEWNSSLSSTVTIQIPAPSVVDNKSDVLDQRVAKITTYLKTVAGIEHITPVDPKESIDLLETWLGSGNIRKELPIPRLVDFTIAKDAELDLTEVEDKIAELVPGSSLDDHKMWLDDLLKFSDRVANAAYITACLVALTALLIIVFATRGELVVHHRTIELLHIMGARNAFIAKQFARSAFWLGLIGGVVGLLAAVLLMYGLSQAFADLAEGLFPDWHLHVANFAILLLLPVFSGLIAMTTAGITVMNKLGKIL